MFDITRQILEAVVQDVFTRRGDAIFIVDDSYKVMFVNSLAAELSGFPGENSIGNYYGKTFKFKAKDSDEGFLRLVEEAMSPGHQKKVDDPVVLENRNGAMASVSVTVTVLADKAGSTLGAAAVFHDVTGNDLLPITVHELRSPLGGMRWSLEMLMSGDAGKLPDVAQGLVNQIHDNNQKLIRLVNDLLDVWRLDQRNVIVKPEPMDVGSAVNVVCTDARLEAAEKKVTIQIPLAGRSLPKVMADPQLFDKIIHNLLSNAIKYAPAGGGGKVIIDGNSSGGFVTINIADNGMGIPVVDQARVFSKFFRARNAILSEVAGTGLGLFIAKSYAEKLGGGISFESEEGKGSTFHIKIPAQP